MDVNEFIKTAISAIMMIVGVTTFIISMTRNSKKDAEDSTRQFSDIREEVMKLRVTLESVNSNVKEIKTEIKTLSGNLQDIDKRLTTVEANLHTAFVRIDELKMCKADKE